MMKQTKSSFLGTFNRLTGAGPGQTADPEQVKRLVLERLQQGPADMRALAELSLPISAVDAAIESLKKQGMVTENQLAGGFMLSDYARKALNYILPA